MTKTIRRAEKKKARKAEKKPVLAFGEKGARQPMPSAPMRTPALAFDEEMIIRKGKDADGEHWASIHTRVTTGPGTGNEPQRLGERKIKMGGKLVRVDSLPKLMPVEQLAAALPVVKDQTAHRIVRSGAAEIIVDPSPATLREIAEQQRREENERLGWTGRFLRMVGLR